MIDFEIFCGHTDYFCYESSACRDCELNIPKNFPGVKIAELAKRS